VNNGAQSQHRNQAAIGVATRINDELQLRLKREPLDLINWNAVSTNLVPPRGFTTLFNLNANNSPQQRYYRALALP
jgi:hypothetical protein